MELYEAINARRTIRDFMPCYIALGHTAPDAAINQQIERNIEDKIHLNGW